MKTNSTYIVSLAKINVRVFYMLDKKKYFMIMVPALILAFLFQFFVPSEQGHLGIVFILAGGVIYYLWVHIEKDKQKD